MKGSVIAFLKRLTTFLEFTIAIILAVGIIMLCARMVVSLDNIPNLDVWPNYDDLLETCFNLIIGVELIRMMYSHTASTVFEVLLFAIARQIIIDHSSAWGSLVGVCAIAVLFATKKFLFSEFSASDEMVFRAGARVKTVNRLLGIDIPCGENETLLDVVSHAAGENGPPITVGTTISFPSCRLRVVSAGNGKVSRIEVIRTPLT